MLHWKVEQRDMFFGYQWKQGCLFRYWQHDTNLILLVNQNSAQKPPKILAVVEQGGRTNRYKNLRHALMVKTSDHSTKWKQQK